MLNCTVTLSTASQNFKHSTNIVVLTIYQVQYSVQRVTFGKASYVINVRTHYTYKFHAMCIFLNANYLHPIQVRTISMTAHPEELLHFI